MNLLAVERIKLFTTRSPWWCALITVALSVGFAAILAGATQPDDSLTVSATQFGGTQFGIAVIMVLAALAVTTEYRFNTIRTTFQAVPHRSPALVAKATVVALLSLVIGEISAFGAWGLAAENLVTLIPKIGNHIHEWLPFNVANKFLVGASAAQDGPPPSDSPLSPGWALAYFAGVAIVFLLVALGVAKKRDA
jgi:ABC-2 type transport system permease protein